MIASIRGEVIQKGQESLVVTVSGVGFQIFVSNELVEKTKPGEFVNLFTQLIVREDSLTLFGFEKDIEKKYFNLNVRREWNWSQISIGDNQYPFD